jgi:methylene-fatty-acyl-phospholipid synthase
MSEMTPEGFAGLLVAAIALAIERLAYFGIWRNPEAFRRWCRRSLIAGSGEPTDALRRLFYGFKLIQALVFLSWIAVHGAVLGEGRRGFVSEYTLAVIVGLFLIVVGQGLNFAVFQRLGRVGVFYGARFGHDVPWVRGFPFSIFTHPQYVGTVASIWGLFLATRFPHEDWIVLPLLETAYYAAGAVLERDRVTPGARRLDEERGSPRGSLMDCKRRFRE